MLFLWDNDIDTGGKGLIPGNGLLLLECGNRPLIKAGKTIAVVLPSRRQLGQKRRLKKGEKCKPFTGLSRYSKKQLKQMTTFYFFCCFRPNEK